MKLRYLLLPIFALLSLSACSGVRDEFGLTKKAPDEFTVVTKAPLIRPPDYTLKPPRPGTPRPQAVPTSETARQALLGNTAPARPQAERSSASRSERIFLKRAGVEQVQPGIRTIIDREMTQVAQKGEGFTDKILFWQNKRPPGEVVDAGKEAERIKEAQAKGQAPSGQGVPVIKRRKRALLENVF